MYLSSSNSENFSKVSLGKFKLSVKDESPKIRELRFNRVIFGAGPSPFLLNATFHHHINLYGTDPAFVNEVFKSLYCDDFVVGIKFY